jgi:hypothetical protein
MRWDAVARALYHRTLAAVAALPHGAARVRMRRHVSTRWRAAAAARSKVTAHQATPSGNRAPPQPLLVSLRVAACSLRHLESSARHFNVARRLCINVMDFKEVSLAAVRPTVDVANGARAALSLCVCAGCRRCCGEATATSRPGKRRRQAHRERRFVQAAQWRVVSQLRLRADRVSAAECAAHAPCGLAAALLFVVAVVGALPAQRPAAGSSAQRAAHGTARQRQATAPFIACPVCWSDGHHRRRPDRSTRCRHCSSSNSPAARL